MSLNSTAFVVCTTELVFATERGGDAEHQGREGEAKEMGCELGGRSATIKSQHTKNFVRLQAFPEGVASAHKVVHVTRVQE